MNVNLESSNNFSDYKITALRGFLCKRCYTDNIRMKPETRLSFFKKMFTLQNYQLVNCPKYSDLGLAYCIMIEVSFLRAILIFPRLVEFICYLNQFAIYRYASKSANYYLFAFTFVIFIFMFYFHLIIFSCSYNMCQRAVYSY